MSIFRMESPNGEHVDFTFDFSGGSPGSKHAFWKGGSLVSMLHWTPPCSCFACSPLSCACLRVAEGRRFF